MKSRIIRKNHIHLLEINRELHPLYGYMSYQPEKACYEAFREAGVKLFFAPVYAGDRGINQQSGVRPFLPGFWKGYDRYDFTAADQVLRRIAGGAEPGEIYIIPRLMVEPPSWWEAENPGELCRDAQGTPVHHSYCSEKWFTDTEIMMAAFRDWLKESGWSRYIAGWHLACGNTEEFLRPQLHPMQYTDYSPCALAAFQSRLRTQYESIDCLNEAWHTEYADWADARFASPAQRIFARQGDLRDPYYERQAIDTYRFISETNARAVVRLCETAKRLTGGDVVIGAFFGYSLMNPDIGHAAADIVFSSDAVDFLASPFSYAQLRKPGVDLPFPGCVGSSMLHDKPWFIEADVRTCLSRPISQCMPHADPAVNRAYDGPVWTGPDTVEGSLGQMKKAFSKVLTSNTAVWWFDMFGGWYDHPDFMEFHRKAAEIYREHALSGGSGCAAPIALFVGEDFSLQTRPESPLNAWFHELLIRLGFTGAPFAQYSFADFEQVDPDGYRMAVFFVPTHWTDDQLSALQKWKKDGRMLVFLGPVIAEAASGIGQICLDGTEALPREPGQPAPFAAPVIRYEPDFSDLILSTGADGHPTSVLRCMQDYTVYSSTALVPGLSLLHKLISAAAGQVYCFDGDVVHASETHIAIHAASDGIKRINLPFKARLADAFTGEVFPGNETFIDVSMKTGETLMMNIERI
ncbi:MAG: beta-galactosidase [Clostridia bacterium]|nr:beta-galactosidase [Clostridia bacterium]